ncbi:SPFH domain-containing protein [Acetanaerobacterium elongatum]|uniref:Membrane protease subunit, stomatin/prohibitin family, contains C-terminal Zn-ribbon domain n=1 Tax=Acetanaerobacterium elongatum TaxID=258515 RepID=A0A1G9W716_9FIRM|nr:SPFH domain-containing protein [Acetanaerobacterium elongatum]SDM80016.1 Membrane protease subunit, stomatin/prohibitin family, contains C-terminal Zn-ribbon domain [Acetanaerobacterium elongatum]
MAIIDRVKFDGLRSRDWIVFKHPADNLVVGTQLIVGEGQAAIFVKSGRVCDLFNAGTYTLSAVNLPILQSLVNIPFGGQTPFTAEIYYLNVVSNLDLQWGTSDPIQIIDPKYYTRLRVRAFGQMGLKLSDYSLFLKELIGVLGPNDIVKFNLIIDYFKGVLVQKLKAVIADIIINQKISALEISAKLDSISETAIERIKPEFSRYGLSIVNFFIKSINFPEEDFEQINEILKNRAEFEIMGDSRYVTKRSFDVYDHAASNESGVAGAFAAGGVGLGLGTAMGYKMQNTINTEAVLDSIKCTSCGISIAGGTKFCPECGASLAPKTCQCGVKLPAGAKFCPECGKKVD